MPGLNIYKASAGSGKTFTLTREFIKLMIADPGRFRNILAVTFTNKATAEMKSRILTELNALAISKDSDHKDYFIRETGLSEKDLAEFARRAINLILHNYSRFHVETIDRFFQRVIRAFTREIGLSAAYNIEIDRERILEEAVDNLLIDLDADPSLSKWIVEFAESKISEGKNWNVKKDILAFGMQTFREEYQEVSDLLFNQLSDRSSLDQYKKELYGSMARFETRMSAFGKRGMQVLSDYQLDISDFGQKSRGPANFFQKLADGVVSGPSKTHRSFDGERNKWPGKETKKRAEVLAAYDRGLGQLLTEAISFWDQQSPVYLAIKEILPNIYLLGILDAITTKIRDLTADKNIFLLSESTRFLSKIIGNADMPFVYEKVGTYFNHFMIDEFQDTSRMQWNNFKPLLSNSLASSQLNLVVGDVKQSIYRWRNGDWEILSDHIHTDFPGDQTNIIPLTENWRSNQNIITFNNHFFPAAFMLLSGKLEREDDDTSGTVSSKLNQVYRDVVQEWPERVGKKEGYIQYTFLEDDEEMSWKDKASQQTIETIRMIQDKGYKAGDIAILVRTADDGKRIARAILEHDPEENGDSNYNFDLISNEILYLANASSVILMLAVMRFINDPSDRINRARLLNEYYRYLGVLPGRVSWNDLYSAAAATGSDDFFSLLPEDFKSRLFTFRNITLFELTERIIRIFGLQKHQGEYPYLQAFQDVVLEYSSSEHADINAFLDWWDVHGWKKSLKAADDNDAIRIMTIHKAKGLEFKAVIIPYCNWSLDHQRGKQNIIWCSPEAEPLNGLSLVPVNYKNSLLETIFAGDYRKEKFRIHVDHLNLLYVAFTRAEECLFAFGPWQPDQFEVLGTVSSLAGMVMTGESEGGFWGEGWYPQDHSWRIGEFQEKSVSDKKEGAGNIFLERFQSSVPVGKLRVRYKGLDFLDPDKVRKINYGKLMHEIFQELVDYSDLDMAIGKMINEGRLTGDDASELKDEVEKAFRNELAMSWFTRDWEVLNEHEIIDEEGNFRRPDRVIINDEKAVVIDFKFGKVKSPAHKEQVTLYRDLVMKMGHETVEGYIWYVKSGEIINV